MDIFKWKGTGITTGITFECVQRDNAEFNMYEFNGYSH